VNNGDGRGWERDTEPEPEKLVAEIRSIRGNIGDLAGELDHRRHALIPRRWGRDLEVLAGALATVAATVGAIVSSQTRRRSNMARLQRLRAAL